MLQSAIKQRQVSGGGCGNAAAHPVQSVVIVRMASQLDVGVQSRLNSLHPASVPDYVLRPPRSTPTDGTSLESRPDGAS